MIQTVLIKTSLSIQLKVYVQRWLLLGVNWGGFQYGYNAHKFSVGKLMLQDEMDVNPEKKELFSYPWSTGIRIEMNKSYIVNTIMYLKKGFIHR